ncbi:MAG: hypothetical protein Q9219_002854 [cf. Caloplaca sp. 3 TL-2023]
MQRLKGLENVIYDAVKHRRPVLTHLNADTSWLISIPYPIDFPRPAGRSLFNILIDPWLQGPQSDFASWFSRQWHIVASSVQTIAELDSCLKALEATAADSSATSSREASSNPSTGTENEPPSHIDIVIVSHEFTDHCNRATLQEIPPETPIFAAEAAARLISSWHYFHHVHIIESLSKRNADWSTTRTSAALPPWLGITRITTRKDALYFHSAILINFVLRPATTMDYAEGIIYTPHGILADDLEILTSASPSFSVLALLHGLHDIKIGVKQLNLGAHNALRAQRICKAKYWVSTHDEVKRAGGLVARLMKRKIWTLDGVLHAEQEKQKRTGINGSLAATDNVSCANLESGESLLLD